MIENINKAYPDNFQLGLSGVNKPIKYLALSILAVLLATDTFMAGLSEPSKFG